MTTLAEALDAVRTLQTELAAVRAQLDWLRKKLFGGGQGERLDRAQLVLQLEALEKLVPPSAAPRQLVRRDLPRGGRRRESFQPLDLQEQLRAVDRLALAAAEELLLEPGNLRPQGRDLFPQGGDFVRRGGGGGHAVS